uniref:Cysteine rich secreted protein n=1 Tax=Riptortus pedestris TaxID=329032 RepID=R4WHU9_RIPPE|nr:cysteine rich secreted protein [Riptortus pedestris]
MVTPKLFLLCAAFFVTVQISYARVAEDIFNNYELEPQFEDEDPEPLSNKVCHCETASCSCCVREFRKTICTSVDFLEKLDEDSLLIQVNLTINDKRVISQKISTDMIPALCYQGMTGLGVCVKLNTRKEETLYKLCTSLQIIYGKKVVNEIDLNCLDVPRSLQITEQNIFEVNSQELYDFI